MTQEDKQLLLKDLCGRAQYGVNILVPKGVRIHDNGKIKESDLIDTVCGVIFYNDEPKIVTPQNFSFLDRNGIRNFGGWTVEEVRPYLRPMSSMTAEERNNLRKYCRAQEGISYDVGVAGAINSPAIIDFLHAHHFDYHGLIERGLALEATENMYKS
jgi:hypothetical protein